MKNLRNFITSTNRNNLRLFISVSIIALIAITGLLVWQTTAQMQTAEQISDNGLPMPTLGNYPNTTINIGANTTITPNVAPTNTTRINVSTNSNFKGLLAANPTTGVVRITNANPAGTYLVTVKAFNASGMTTRTFTLTVGNGPICNFTVQFTNAPDVSFNGFARSLAIGDFNNDGIQDIARTSFFVSPEFEFSNNIVSILLGNGTGGFSGTTTVGVARGPSQIAIGDFNNDGNQDFITANIQAGVSIGLGNGLGGFTSTTDSTIDSVVRGSIAIGDFNNDGNQDFAVIRQFPETVFIRLGNGSGSFGSPIQVNSATSPSNLAIGDFNNDGKQDLAVLSRSSMTVSIRLGDGLGGFSGSTQVAAGSNSFNLTIGDFNNDGNQDLAIVNMNSSGTVSIRLGDGLGGFSGSTEVSVGNNPSSVVIGDFNNDGNLDLEVGSSPTIIFLFGNGLGGFTANQVINGGFGGIVGDFNNDGKQDLAGINSISGSLIEIKLGGCSVAPTATPTLGNYPNTSVTVGANTTITPDAVPTNTTRINVSTNTNFKGLLAANPTTGVVRVTNAHPAGTYLVTIKAFNDTNGMIAKTFTLTVSNGTVCNGTVQFTTAPNVSTGAFPRTITIGDFNNDGNQDFITANQTSNTVSVRLGDGTGNITNNTSEVFVGNSPFSVAVGDFNNDGNQDFAAANRGDSTISIRLGNGLGNFTGNEVSLPNSSFPVGISIADFNNDGKQDFVVTGSSGNAGAVYVRFGDGTGNFSGNFMLGNGEFAVSASIGDFNNDGNQDFVTANPSNSTFVVFTGNGVNNFNGVLQGTVNSIAGVTVGNFNNDSSQDLVIPNSNVNTVTIFLGNGLPGFNNPTTVGVGSQPSSSSIGDFNNDGRQDIAVANANDGTVSLLLGNGSGTFINSLTIPVVGDAFSIATADFNNDGIQDFAVAGRTPRTVAIRLGGCSVTPTPTPTPTVSPTPTPNPTATPTPTPTPGSEIDLRISQNDAPDPVMVGQPLTYTLTVFIRRFSGQNNVSPQIRFNYPGGVPFVFNSANGTDSYTATPDAFGVTFSGGAFTGFGDATGTFNIIITPQSSGTLTSLGNNVIVDSTNVVFETNENNNTAQTITTTVTPSNVCTPSTTVTEGDLFPGGIVSFGVTSGAGSVTVDHVNAGTGLQSLTVVNSTNAVVNIPAFTPGTQMPVVVTFTPINPGLAVDFTLRAASTFHAANIRARCAEVCTPSTTVTEGNLFPGGIVSFGITSGPGSVTVDHVNAGTGTQSLTVVGTPTNAVVNIPAFTAGTTMPIVVTFTPIDPNQPVDFTLRAASTFHAANVRVRCGVTSKSGVSERSVEKSVALTGSVTKFIQ